MVIGCLMSIHIIGAIIAIVIHCKDGTMEYASKYGDGFRFAKPSDRLLIMGNSINNSYNNFCRRLHK